MIAFVDKALPESTVDKHPKIQHTELHSSKAAPGIGEWRWTAPANRISAQLTRLQLKMLCHWKREEKKQRAADEGEQWE